MKPMIRNERGWNVHSHQMKVLLGLRPEDKLPAEGMPEREIQGIKVYVLSLEQARKEKMFHRVRSICPMCGTHLSAGRLHQHVCKE